MLVRDGTQALILDAGTGLRRLVTQPEYLDGVTRIDIALTHFHLDRASGAARVAREANARRLTLVHLDPRADEPALLAHAPGAALGRDGAELY